MTLALALSLVTTAHAGCGPDAGPCTTPDGTYHLILPEPAATGPIPAVMFLHGWGGSGEGVSRMAAMARALSDRGYALIAPDGSPRPGREGNSWAFRPRGEAGEGNRDEASFLKGVADDAATRFGLDRGDMVLAGFSLGGSMVSYLACDDPGAFAAYAPVAGTFWSPEPDACKGPVRLFHVHGWLDETMPLEGRILGSDFVQGDVFTALGIWRAASGCDARRPDTAGREGDWLIRHWTSCAPGGELFFALTDQGHKVPDGWAGHLLDWYEAAPAP